MAAMTRLIRTVHRSILGLFLLTTGLALVGCGGGGDFPVAYTSGRVLCEGQPVPNVIVFFEPLSQGKSALAGKQGIGYTDADGKFVISTYGKQDGAVIGKHRVRVAPPRDPEPDFRCDCVLNPERDILQVEVQEGGKNAFELVLQKKTGNEPPLPYHNDEED